jgi:toxin ParE1/3/4
VAVSIHDEAGQEATVAQAWYEAQRPGLGLRFASALDAALDRIEAYPNKWTPDRKGYRRYIVDEFPYVVVYKLIDDDVRVIAFAHQKRRPRYWSKRQ